MLIIVIYFCIVREGDYFMPACFYTVLQLFSVYEIQVSFFPFLQTSLRFYSYSKSTIDIKTFPGLYVRFAAIPKCLFLRSW